MPADSFDGSRGTKHYNRRMNNSRIMERAAGYIRSGVELLREEFRAHGIKLPMRMKEEIVANMFRERSDDTLLPEERKSARATAIQLMDEDGSLNPLISNGAYTFLYHVDPETKDVHMILFNRADGVGGFGGLGEDSDKSIEDGCLREVREEVANAAGFKSGDQGLAGFQAQHPELNL